MLPLLALLAIPTQSNITTRSSSRIRSASTAIIFITILSGWTSRLSSRRCWVKVWSMGERWCRGDLIGLAVCN